MVTKFANLQLVALNLGYFYICRIITNTKKSIEDTRSGDEDLV